MELVKKSFYIKYLAIDHYFDPLSKRAFVGALLDVNCAYRNAKNR
jgi:hypothetical protein